MTEIEILSNLELNRLEKSKNEIERWEGIEKDYETRKFKYLPENKDERMKLFREKLLGYQQSLSLGREFNESVDDYYNRIGLKEFDNWATKKNEESRIKYNIPIPKWIRDDKT